MTNKRFEGVSALVDSELTSHDARGLLTDLQQDVVLRQCWEHYHLIGDAMRNNLPDTVKHDLAQRIQSALATEPPLPIPLSLAARKRSQRTSLPAFFRPVVGFAVAASVTALAVIGFNLTAPTGSAVPSLAAAPGAAPAVVTSVTPIAPAVPQVASANHPTPPVVVATATSSSTKRQAEMQARLLDYLLSHSQYSAASALQPEGALPYARLVGYEPNAANKE